MICKQQKRTVDPLNGLRSERIDAFDDRGDGGLQHADDILMKALTFCFGIHNIIYCNRFRAKTEDFFTELRKKSRIV